MVGSSYRKEVHHSRRPRDRRSREELGSSSGSRIPRTTTRKDSISSADDPSRCSRRSKYSNDTRSFSSSGSEISCRHHGKHRSRRYDYTKRRRDRRREYSPASSYRSSSSDPSNVMSIDTAVNSESRLQDIGRVVKASDLSDYSDQYTLGSREMEEFEEYLKKHKSRGHRNFYDSDSEGSSAIYSLDDSLSVNPGAGTSDDTSGVVEVESSARKGIVGCGYKTCFCIDDDSIQGSYGGLREDEVLLASTPSLKTRGSADMTEADDFTNSVDVSEVSGRSMSRRVERMESTAESISSHASDIQDRDDCESVKTAEPSGFSRFFCTWDPTSRRSDVESDDDDDDGDDDEEEDGYDDLPQVVTTSMTQHGNDSTVSYTSSNVVWQRTSSYDSIAESLSEDRAEAIAKKARAETILNRFKQEKQREDKPLEIHRVPSDSQKDLLAVETTSNASKDVEVDDQRTVVQEPENKTGPENLSSCESNGEITEGSTYASDSKTTGISSTNQPNDLTATNSMPDPVFTNSQLDSIITNSTTQSMPDHVISNTTPPPENEVSTPQGNTSTEHDAPPLEEFDRSCNANTELEAPAVEEFDRSYYDRTYILGDNVEVATMTELEAGNGDTGFLIYLRVSREALTAKGEAIVQRLMTTRGQTLMANAPLGKGIDITRSEGDSEDGIAVFIVTETDGQGSHDDPPRLLIEENATHYIKTLSRLSEASYHCLDIKTQQEVCRVVQSTKFSEIPLKTTDWNENQHSGLTSCPSSREGLTQFIFCMRPNDMIYKEVEHKDVADDEAHNNDSLAINALTSFEENKVTPQPSEAGSDYAQSDANNDTDSRIADEHTVAQMTGGHDATPVANDALAATSTAQVTDSPTELPDSFDKYIEDFAKSCEGEEIPNTVRQALAAAISKDRSNPKYLRGMSRATVRAHVLLQGGKIPRHFYRSKSARAADSTTDTTAGKRVISPKHACSLLVGAGEDSTSSRGLSLHRSSGEESLKGTRFIHDEAKSLSGSFSNHSSGIHGYLQFLEEQDNEDDTESGCRPSEQSLEKFSQQTKNISDKAVAEAMDILTDLNFNLNYDDSYSADGNDSESPTNEPTHESAPIPSHIPNVNALLFGHNQDTKCEVVTTTRSDLSSGERQLKSYEDRWRLSQQLLLSENPARPSQSRSGTRQGIVEFEKSQIDCIGLLRKRRTASVASSQGSSGSCDEFFDAVSQNSSSSSVE